MPQDNQFGRLNNLYKEKISIKTKKNHIERIQYRNKNHIDRIQYRKRIP
jgi:hypothetical protein